MANSSCYISSLTLNDKLFADANCAACHLSEMRKKIDAMRVEREEWTAHMRQIDADLEDRKLNAKKSVVNRLKVWLSELFEIIKVKIKG